MVTVEYNKACELCGQPVEIEGFRLISGSEALVFCCAGCQGIYKLIYSINREHAVDKAIDNSKKTNNSNEDI
jgi:Putative metal-binding domain of cation transport ATPase